MTDARLPERWLVDRRLLRLSDSAYRTFTTALLWSVANRTDGRLEAGDVDLMLGARSLDVPELLKAGLMDRDGTDLTLVDFEATQTSRNELEVLENNRRREREKKQRQRAKGTGSADTTTVPGDSPEGSTPVRVPGTAQAGRQDRQEGKDRLLEGVTELDEDELLAGLAEHRSELSWP